MVSRISNDYAGKLTVLKINKLTNPVKSGQYEVEQTPNTLFFKAGQVTNRIAGYMSYEKLKAATDNALQEQPNS